MTIRWGPQNSYSGAITLLSQASPEKRSTRILKRLIKEWREIIIQQVDLSRPRDDLHGCW